MQNNYIDDETEFESSRLKVFSGQNTAHINVYLEASYIENQSKLGQYTFSYKVNLENVGDITSQIIARHWIITDGDGETREIKGLGIVGEQPTLQPGQKYEYSSITVLSTKIGTMKGTYLCVTEAGEIFAAAIPECVLALPKVLH